ncbi:SNARE associated Golgi protein [Rubripirellula lacrimiformis]|uniref:TVP38/TMEM64 family membrane protein n=1 Tax=Rubripirellula lacrimiformis TaxID=1930273 RepID=A0A517N5M4_9BACT|nr:VTT domain-containing protein [Rubripirellula lacrimiformis]QDT02423.1 SNARE associated Golgi protein [Rubripirellula lacrimiformis]
MDLTRPDSQPRKPAHTAPARLRWFRRIAPVVLVAIGVSLLATGFNAEQLRGGLAGLGSAAPVIFVITSIFLMSVMVPKTIVSVTAGALFGTFTGTSLMLVIAVTAATVNYMIGRWWLSDIANLASRSTADDGAKPTASDWLATAQSMAREAGFGFHLLLRLAPIPTMLISYSMGGSRARIGPFLAAAAVAVIPQSLWVHCGTVATMIDDPRTSGLRWASLAISVIGAIVVSIVIPRQAIQRLRQQRPASAH